MNLSERTKQQVKCTKIASGWGSAADPAGGVHDAPPDPLVRWGRDTLPTPHPIGAYGASILVPCAFGTRLSACCVSIVLPYQIYNRDAASGIAVPGSRMPYSLGPIPSELSNSLTQSRNPGTGSVESWNYGIEKAVTGVPGEIIDRREQCMTMMVDYTNLSCKKLAIKAVSRSDARTTCSL